MKFQEMTSPKLEAVDRDQTVVMLPIAACEQHGPHMPTGTDTIICQAIAESVEQQNVHAVLLLPTIWLGASSHHLRFGATLTVELDTYISLLCETLEPLLHEGYRRVMMLNGHGGNIDPMRVALRRLQPQFPDVLLTAGSYWSIAVHEIASLLDGESKSVGHACEAETSLMMHLRPELVDMSRIANAGGWLPDDENGLYVCRDMFQRTDAGATGRPDLASPEKGAALFSAIVLRVTAAVAMQLAEPLPE